MFCVSSIIVVVVLLSAPFVRMGIASPFGILEGKRDDGSFPGDALDTADFGSGSGDAQIIDASGLDFRDSQTASQSPTLDVFESDQVVPQSDMSSSLSNDTYPSSESPQDALISASDCDPNPSNGPNAKKRSPPPNDGLRSCPARNIFRDPYGSGRGSYGNYEPYQQFRSKKVILESDDTPCKGQRSAHVTCGGPKVVMGTAYVYVFNCKFGEGFMLLGRRDVILGGDES